MLVLGIETSCDETAAAVVRDGREVLGESLATQFETHRRFGGVVPELACRGHVSWIDRVVREALNLAGKGLSDLDAVAVTKGPGLIGALLVGVSFAKSLAFGRGLPVLGVNHLEGHLYAPCLEGKRLHFPCVALVVSGGHTHLFMVKQAGDYRLIGRTRDDAAGEALDKAAKLLGLGYPGGPVIDRLAKEGDPAKIEFPRPTIRSRDLDFSFSGLKTALVRYVKANPREVESGLADIAAGYQQAVVDVLVEKTLRAAREFRVEGLIVGGGVASNTVLRERLRQEADRSGLDLIMPKPRLCTDNASMIAAAAHRHFEKGAVDGMAFDARADLVLGH